MGDKSLAIQYGVLLIQYEIVIYVCSQACIRGHRLGKEKVALKTGNLLKEVQFI